MNLMNVFKMLLLLGLLLGATPASALLVKSLTLKQMIERSPIIFKGSVVDITIEADPYESGLDVSYYRFRCEDVLKGECDGEIVLKQPLGLREALVSYKKGSSYLIFLSGASKLGFSAPIGLEQGVSEIIRQGNTEVLGNKILVKKLENNLTASQKSLVQTRQTILPSQDYQQFRQQLESLVREAQ